MRGGAPHVLVRVLVRRCEQRARLRVMVDRAGERIHGMHANAAVALARKHRGQRVEQRCRQLLAFGHGGKGARQVLALAVALCIHEARLQRRKQVLGQRLRGGDAPERLDRSGKQPRQVLFLEQPGKAAHDGFIDAIVRGGLPRRLERCGEQRFVALVQDQLPEQAARSLGQPLPLADPAEAAQRRDAHLGIAFAARGLEQQVDGGRVRVARRRRIAQGLGARLRIADRDARPHHGIAAPHLHAQRQQHVVPRHHHRPQREGREDERDQRGASAHRLG